MNATRSSRLPPQFLHTVINWTMGSPGNDSLKLRLSFFFLLAFLTKAARQNLEQKVWVRGYGNKAINWTVGKPGFEVIQH